MTPETSQIKPDSLEYGARIYRVPAKQGRLLIKQTVKRGDPPKYAIDEQRERFVAENDDAAIAAAVRDALAGKFEKSKKPTNPES